ncbi:nuclear transport factor 2 family protein [Kibdelosporangium persicum]|uniref:Ketosteroid isomerase-like n=1 Tax=Kibdelosporangium persicum TaxID=2698649 RepID=A0ABX2FHA1_9PSEU|nr:nuclear transport factor 2 family protein [Kibdelosporangium persicum]NRN70774.1 Ketosteroid isomerase-like [Kibdelosporangium persicum]
MATDLTTRVFTAVDARDAKAFSEFFAGDGRLVFGNGEPMAGAHAIAEGVGQFFTTISGLRHQVVNEWVTGPDTVVELKVTYDRLDGRSVTVPAVSIWHLDTDDLIDDYRIYIDLAPVYAPST